MRIYRMTATFGKLENQTLTLEPGLNIISAPNEWGKSTWCAFLATMLYGLDTREKTTKTSLALKERFAPWSGSPMSGRIDLNWDGKNITIERWTKGRTPMGEFRAYETESGLTVTELTAANCGEMLLGVERGVFLRAGFLRLADLPVTADESLRRRLNALVTTGDESGAADILAQKLKDLKNKVRYNRSGLLPQAEAQRNELQAKLQELQILRSQSEKLQLQRTEAEAKATQLKNHRAALQYAAAQESIQRVTQAHIEAEKAAEAMANAEDRCMGLIGRDEAVSQLNTHASLLQNQAALVQEWNALPPEPIMPQIPERYQGVTVQEAIVRARKDAEQYTGLEHSQKESNKRWMILGCIGAAGILIAMLVGSIGLWIGVTIAIALASGGMFFYNKQQEDKIDQQLQVIFQRYSGISPNRWVEDAVLYAENQQQYEERLQNALHLRENIRKRMDAVESELSSLTSNMPSQDFLLSRNEIIAAHDTLTDARREHQQKAAHAATLGAIVKNVLPPTLPDTLTYSEAQTEQMLADLDFDMKQLQLRLGQYEGRMDSLGSEAALQNQLEAVHIRIEKLTETYNALELAQQTLEKATAELQRRFAPRISQQAQELFGKLTGGRYDRLNLQQDLSVNAASTEDVAMRSAQWRSEGTIDQLYLALRLAVARELTPNAPLVLDDVLVRFDDTRHAAAMEILHQEANQKQVILFTCQSREK